MGWDLRSDISFSFLDSTEFGLLFISFSSGKREIADGLGQVLLVGATRPFFKDEAFLDVASL